MGKVLWKINHPGLSLYEPARNTESYILALDLKFHFSLLNMRKLQMNV